MDSRLRFSVIVGKATFVATSGMLVLISLAFLVPSLKLEPKATIVKLLALAAEVVLPITTAAWWMFPKLAAIYPRREARAVATTFGIFGPIGLSLGIVLGGPLGAFALSLYAHQALVLVGVYLGASAIAAASLLAVCALALRITRLAISVEQND
jgi:hypothetical protein